MQNPYLSPGERQEFLDIRSAAATRATKSLVTRFSYASIVASFTNRIIETSRKPGTRKRLNSGKWNTHRGTRSEGHRPKDTSSRIHPEGSTQANLQSSTGDHEIPASTTHVNIGAQFDSVINEHLDIFPDIQIIPPTAANSDILEGMANNNLQQLGPLEAAVHLTSSPHRIEVTFPPDVNYEGRRAAPRANPNPGRGPALGRVEPLLEAAFDVVRRNGGEVKIRARAAPVGQMVTCDALGCDQPFASAEDMTDHRNRNHAACPECNRWYANLSREEHIRQEHPHQL